MPVPTTIDDLDPDEANNFPIGSDNVFPELDNYLRAHAAFIAELRDRDSAFALTLLDDTTAAEAVATLGLSDTTDSDEGATHIGYKPIYLGSIGRLLREKLEDWVSITDFGGVGDGSTNNDDALADATTYMVSLSARKRTLFIPPGQFNFTTWTIPADCDFLSVVGSGRMASRLFSTATTAGVVIDCLAQGVHFHDLRLQNEDFDTTTVLRHGIRFQKPDGETADIDAVLSNCELSEFYYGVEFWGRGLKIDNCLFSICQYPINLNWPDIADYIEGSDTAQKDLTGFRAFQFTNNRFHSIGQAAIRNEGANAEKINGVLVKGSMLDIGRSLWDGVLKEALIDGFTITQTPTAGFNLTDGSRDYVVSNGIIAGDIQTSPDRDPTNFITLRGDHTNGVFRNLLLKNCDSHGIDIRTGTVTAMTFENLTFVNPCQSVGTFCPIAFVGGGHTAVVRNVVVSTSYALTGIVRTDDVTTFIQVDDCRSYGASIPAIVGTGAQYIDRKYAQAWMVGSGQVGVYAGSGTPEGSVTAVAGSIYLRVLSGAGAGTSFYVKESGSGNTGWVAK